MAKRNRRNPKEQYIYEIGVEDWSADVFFNEHAHINIFDLDEFAERFYITIKRAISWSLSKKVKEGQRALVVIHPTTVWDNKRLLCDDIDNSIGEVSTYKREDHKLMIFKVSIPFQSYELVRSSLIYKAKGRVRLAGEDLMRSGALINYFDFRSSVDDY